MDVIIVLRIVFNKPNSKNDDINDNNSKRKVAKSGPGTAKSHKEDSEEEKKLALLVPSYLESAFGKLVGTDFFL